MNIEISIVTGTYNRIEHMKLMVYSVRRSIGVGIPYEIVAVDGGSTDGTIQWCESQSDIVLIKQGKLLGAVKAFNEGAYAAKGRYVVLANDDIEFLDESLLCAISFMQDNSNVGVGCFYQDRGNKTWHVEQMPAVSNGRQISAYYGQVCIVPKWLGDKVGWWGDYLHTYGGDNELSCNVLEMGYKIEPVPCSKIHDALPMDELRKTNNVVQKIHGQHPDTYKWLQKWTRNGLVGPNVHVAESYKKLPRYYRFFYMPIYEKHPVQKQSKRGLRDALSEVGLVVEYDYQNEDMYKLLDVACAIDPDIFVMQMQGHDSRYFDMLVELKSRHPKAIFVNWNGDYHPEILFHERYIRLMRYFDHVGIVTTSVKESWDAAHIDWFYWQIGYEEVPEHLSLKGVPKHDVVFLANGYSKHRLELARMLRNLGGIDVGLYGSWPDYVGANGNTLYDFEAGAKLYRAAKIAIGDSQWPNATGFVSNRLFQSMSAGAFLLHQYFDGMEELLGLRDGEHLVVWRSTRDLKDKIEYYLKDENARKRIATQGKRFVETNHSFQRRVDELLKKIL